MLLKEYDTEGFFDELLESPGKARLGMEDLLMRLDKLEETELRQHQYMAEQLLYHLGITFNAYGEEGGTERIFPFDVIPRIITAKEWAWLERGLKQRIEALNLFLQDVYNKGRIIKDGVVPIDIVHSSEGYKRQCLGLTPPKGIWCHISGIDLVRDGDGQIYVLEDNLRCPSGVSYVLENREVMKRSFPKFFSIGKVRSVEDYPAKLLEALQFVSSANIPDPEVALLTPGIFNSAYFEHSFLARQMGIELVEGSDLCIQDGYVQMRTTRGMSRVNVLYRRIDDDFLDPKSFRTDSMLGVPGIMDVYRKGNITLVNAPGTGVADDKVMYSYVPQIIKYYLDQDPIIPNVPTFRCGDEKDMEHVIKNMDKMVIKPANESGGYGLLIGPHATKEQREDFALRIRNNPRNYIAQPTLSLSRVPTICTDGCEGRHVDLRPYVVYGKDIHVLPGGLTRVALKKGSLVVNSSQGGGSKDTWVLS